MALASPPCKWGSRRPENSVTDATVKLSARALPGHRPAGPRRPQFRDAKPSVAASSSRPSCSRNFEASRGGLAHGRLARRRLVFGHPRCPPHHMVRMERAGPRRARRLPRTPSKSRNESLAVCLAKEPSVSTFVLRRPPLILGIALSARITRSFVMQREAQIALGGICRASPLNLSNSIDKRIGSKIRSWSNGSRPERGTIGRLINSAANTNYAVGGRK